MAGETTTLGAERGPTLGADGQDIAQQAEREQAVERELPGHEQSVTMQPGQQHDAQADNAICEGPIEGIDGHEVFEHHIAAVVGRTTGIPTAGAEIQDLCNALDNLPQLEFAQMSEANLNLFTTPLANLAEQRIPSIDGIA